MLQTVVERFASINEFLTTCENKENRAGNKAFSKIGDADFTGTESLTKANELLLYGDKKTFEKMVEISVKQAPSFIEKSKLKRHVSGFSPCVPAYLSGLPNSMYTIHKIKPPAVRMELYYSPTATCDIHANELQRAGVVMLSIVNALERRGISVSLNILNKCSITNRREATICCVNVKKAGMPLDGLKAAYCLANPSFFRRHGFLWYETCERIQNPDFYGYGATITDCNKIITLLQNNGVNMKQSRFINFYKVKELRYDMSACMKYLDIEE